MNDSIQSMNKLRCRRNCSTCCQKIVCQEYSLTWLKRIFMNFQRVRPILQRVFNPFDSRREFSRFANRHEGDPQFQGEWSTDEKAPWFNATDSMKLCITIATDQQLKSLLKCSRVTQQGRDVSEEYSRFWKVMNRTDKRFEMDSWFVQSMLRDDREDS